MEIEKEKTLVERAKQDSQAFGELYERYYSPIFNYILRRTADITTAEDVTSEVFFKALKNIKGFQYRDVPFSAWLYRIATNEITNFHRKNGKWVYHLEDSLESLPDSSIIADDELLQAEQEIERHKEFLELKAEIFKLKSIYQEVITLRYFENKSLKDISLILQKREGTIKSLLHRGLEKLRKSIE